MAIGPSPNQALRDAVARAGGQSALARTIGTSQAAVWKWLQKGKPLPAEHVLAVEAATGISRHRLRPDVFGAGDKAAPAALASGDLEPAR